MPELLSQAPEVETRSEPGVWNPTVTVYPLETLAALDSWIEEETPGGAELLVLSDNYPAPAGWWEETADPFAPDNSSE